MTKLRNKKDKIRQNNKRDFGLLYDTLLSGGTYSDYRSELVDRSLPQELSQDKITEDDILAAWILGKDEESELYARGGHIHQGLNSNLYRQQFGGTWNNPNFGSGTNDGSTLNNGSSSSGSSKDSSFLNNAQQTLGYIQMFDTAGSNIFEGISTYGGNSDPYSKYILGDSSRGFWGRMLNQDDNLKEGIDLINSNQLNFGVGDNAYLQQQYNQINPLLRSTMDTERAKWAARIVDPSGLLRIGYDPEKSQEAINNAIDAVNARNIANFNTAVTNSQRLGIYNQLSQPYMAACGGKMKNRLASGGYINSHYDYITDPLVKVDAGGTHQENPNEGVLTSIAPDGEPNLVEEGETIINNGQDDAYVFSDRIVADEEILKSHLLPNKFAGKTYADISKELDKIIDEHKNDEISKRTFDEMINRLQQAQEDQKYQEKAEEVAKFIDGLSDEEKEQLEQTMVEEAQAEQQADEEQAVAEQQAQEQAAQEQQMQPEQSPEQVAMEQPQEQIVPSRYDQMMSRSLFADAANQGMFDLGGHLHQSDNSFMRPQDDVNRTIVFNPPLGINGDYKIYEEPNILPVNKEGLPYYRLKEDIDVVADKLPTAKYTDNNLYRYFDAVQKGLIGLNDILDKELRNRVRGYNGYLAAQKGMKDAAKVAAITAAIPTSVILASQATGVASALGETLADYPIISNAAKAYLASEIGGRAVDLASKATTGNNFSENVGNVVYGATGYNPNDSYIGSIVTDILNPGYSVAGLLGLGARFGRSGKHVDDIEKYILKEYKISKEDARKIAKKFSRKNSNVDDDVLERVDDFMIKGKYQMRNQDIKDYLRHNYNINDEHELNRLARKYDDYNNFDDFEKNEILVNESSKTGLKRPSRKERDKIVEDAIDEAYADNEAPATKKTVKKEKPAKTSDKAEQKPGLTEEEKKKRKKFANRWIGVPTLLGAGIVGYHEIKGLGEREKQLTEEEIAKQKIQDEIRSLYNGWSSEKDSVDMRDDMYKMFEYEDSINSVLLDLILDGLNTNTVENGNYKPSQNHLKRKALTPIKEPVFTGFTNTQMNNYAKGGHIMQYGPDDENRLYYTKKGPLYYPEDDFMQEYPEFGDYNGFNKDYIKETDNILARNYSDSVSQDIPDIGRELYSEHPVFLRYAPAIGSGLQYLSDALGITNKNDYTNANLFQKSINSIPTVNYLPIGNSYLNYTPLDELYQLNAIKSATNAARRSVVNSGSGNAGAVLAALNSLNNNEINTFGDLRIKVADYNNQMAQKVAEHNFKINLINSSLSLSAQEKNLAIAAERARLNYNLAQMRQNIEDANDMAKAANYTNLMTNLGNIGRENFIMNQVNSNMGLYYYVDDKGIAHYKASYNNLSDDAKKMVDDYIKSKGLEIK